MACIHALDEMEDSGPLRQSEAQERRTCRDEVTEVDLRYEMDWRQRSQQIWLAAGDANTQFFHQFANGRRQQNKIRCLRVGDQTVRDQASVGQALAAHFRKFYQQGPQNRWRWMPTTASTLPFALAASTDLPLLAKGSEGYGLGPDGIPVVGLEVMTAMEEFRGNRCRMESLNRAYLVLIPKTAGPEHI